VKKFIFILLLLLITQYIANAEIIGRNSDNVSYALRIADNQHRIGDAVYDTAKGYEGITENSQAGKRHIQKFLKSVGLKGDYAWCAAFVSYCLSVNNVREPAMRSASARKFILKTSINANDVLRGTKQIEKGDLVIWSRGNTAYGHIEIVKKWDKKQGISIGGNTTAPKGKGIEYDGDGVYEKTRIIQPANYFRITHFTKVR